MIAEFYKYDAPYGANPLSEMMSREQKVQVCDARDDDQGPER